MKSWANVNFPIIDTQLLHLPLFLTNTKTGSKERVSGKSHYRIYVCGITPYDATHLGHAATYLSFDLINRYLRAQGATINYVQNITDIDDPLLERAKRDCLNWEDLASAQIDLFRDDMVKLRVIPPEHYIGAVETISLVEKAIASLQERETIYSLEGDYYFSNASDSDFGALSHLTRSKMVEIFAQRGGNPYLVGKLDPLDPVVWLCQRLGEPGWFSYLGTGRPGWHIECTAIALEFLEPDPTQETLIDIQGGGSDLIFPHHEMCRSQAKILTGKELASNYVHAGMIALDGEKMSKSKGNLVFVSQLMADGVDPMAIRYALLKEQYHMDRAWSSESIGIATSAVGKLRQALTISSGMHTSHVIETIVAAIADDLDTPKAFAAIEKWVEETLAGATGGDTRQLRDLIDALLGISF